jgi:hypothetical protein
VSRHVSAEHLALRHEAAVSARKAARIDAHLSACAKCAATNSDLSAVSSLLEATPLPPMPDYLFQRVQLAIAAESANRAAMSERSGAGAHAAGTVDVSDGRAEGDAAPEHIPGRPDLPDRAGRAPRRFRMPGMSSPIVLRGLAATAAVIVIAGGGFLLARDRAGQSESNTSGAGTRNAAPANPSAPSSGQTNRYTNVHYHIKGKDVATTALATRTNFTRHSLARQVRRTLRSTVGLGPTYVSSRPVPTGNKTAPALGVNVSRLEGCLSRVDAGRAVLLADVAQFLGRPATIIVLRPSKSAGILDVLVVGIKCSASVADVIFQTTIPAS